jgi:hypothetical protein
MSNQDELMRKIMRDHADRASTLGSIGHLQREIAENRAIALGSLGRMQQEIMDYRDRTLGTIGRRAFEVANSLTPYQKLVTEAANSLAAFRDPLGQETRRLLEEQREFIKAFRMPNIGRELAAEARQSLLLAKESYQASALRAATGLGDTLKDTRTRALEETLRHIRDSRLNMIGGVSGVASFVALAREQMREYEGLRQTFPSYEKLNASFAGTLTDSLSEFLRSSNFNEDAISKVEEVVNEKIASLPKGRITAEGLFMMFLQIVTVLIAIGAWNTDKEQLKEAKESSKTQAVQYGQFMVLFEKVAKDIEQLVPKHDDSVYYVVERQVSLKLKPNHHSATVAILSPNQKVRLVQMNHKWIYIEYFDYLEGVPKYGWANKKYLKRLGA